MFPGFNALCSMQMLHDLLQQCTQQWEEQEGNAAGNDLPGWTAGDIVHLTSTMDMMKAPLLLYVHI
jgi:hypothetical protein